eukprot:SAG11_NODE_7488_length_1137_cov_2.144509_2_plen_82_part_00
MPCACQEHWDIRRRCSPNSFSFVKCKVKISTAVWHLQDDCVCEDDEWEEGLRSMLEAEEVKARVYTDEEINAIVKHLKVVD